MAGEIQFSFKASASTYFLVRSRVGQIWSTSGGTGAFENYATANYTDYAISATQQGSASAFYAGNFPAAITPGVFGITAKEQLGGSAAETDPTVAVGDYQWNGTVTLPLSDLTTSGQLGQLSPIKVARGCQILNFPIYFKSSVDHVTPLTSGVCSGQISRDGGNFAALQSGAFTEVGLGFYTTTLTSGDLLCNSAALSFSAVGISGGTADPVSIGLLLQKVSGSI